MRACVCVCVFVLFVFCVCVCVCVFQCTSVSVFELVLCTFLQKDWREDYNGDFKKKVMRCVRKSQDCV